MIAYDRHSFGALGRRMYDRFEDAGKLATIDDLARNVGELVDMGCDVLEVVALAEQACDLAGMADDAPERLEYVAAVRDLAQLPDL